MRPMTPASPPAWCSRRVGGPEALCGLAAIALGVADLCRQGASTGWLRLSAIMACAGLITAIGLGVADWRAVAETPLVVIAFMSLAELALAWVDLRRLRGLPPPRALSDLVESTRSDEKGSGSKS